MKRVRVKGHMSKVCASYGKKRKSSKKKGCSYGPRRKGKCPPKR
jgi:hypothetical protein